MSVAVVTEGKGGTLALRITGGTSVADAGQGYFANPWGQSVIILRGTLYVATASTGAANISIGVAATSATAATDLINALAMNGAIAGKMYNCHAMQNGAKTEIAAPALWTSSQYVTFTASADMSGLDATLFLECVPV